MSHIFKVNMIECKVSTIPTKVSSHIDNWTVSDIGMQRAILKDIARLKEHRRWIAIDVEGFGGNIPSLVGFGRIDLTNWYAPRQVTLLEDTFDGVLLVGYGMSGDSKMLNNVGHIHSDSKLFDLSQTLASMSDKPLTSLKSAAEIVKLEKKKSPGAQSHSDCTSNSIDYLLQDVIITAELFESFLYTSTLSRYYFYAIIHLLGYDYVSNQVDFERVDLKKFAKELTKRHGKSRHS